MGNSEKNKYRKKEKLQGQTMDGENTVYLHWNHSGIYQSKPSKKGKKWSVKFVWHRKSVQIV